MPNRFEFDKENEEEAEKHLVLDIDFNYDDLDYSVQDKLSILK